MHRVRYDAALLVKTSLVEAMLEGEAGAQDQVDEVVLLQKMPGWKYENEWLLIGTRGGAQDNTSEISEIVFGLRCPNAVQFALYRASEKRDQGLEFSTNDRTSGTLNLVKTPLDTDELSVLLPRRARDVLDWFADADG